MSDSQTLLKYHGAKGARHTTPRSAGHILRMGLRMLHGVHLAMLTMLVIAMQLSRLVECCDPARASAVVASSDEFGIGTSVVQRTPNDRSRNRRGSSGSPAGHRSSNNNWRSMQRELFDDTLSSNPRARSTQPGPRTLLKDTVKVASKEHPY